MVICVRRSRSSWLAVWILALCADVRAQVVPPSEPVPVNPPPTATGDIGNLPSAIDFKALEAEVGRLISNKKEQSYAPALLQAAAAELTECKSDDTGANNDLLVRDIIELSLSSLPIVRTSCTLTAFREGRLAEAKTVQWDPESSLPLTRRIRVRGGASWSVQCGSEPLLPQSYANTLVVPGSAPPTAGAAAGVGGVTSSTIRGPLVYGFWKPQDPPPCSDSSTDADLLRPAVRLAQSELRFERVRGARLLSPDARCSFCAPPGQPFLRNKIVLRLILEDPTQPVKIEDGAVAAAPTLQISVGHLRKIAVSAGDDGSTIATNRSIIPFDEVVADLATTMAEVAVDRAKTNATELIRDRLAEVFCDRLTVKNLRANLDGGELGAWLPQSRQGPLLPMTCQAVRGVRITEMAASGIALRRALARDLTMLAFDGFGKLAGSGDEGKALTRGVTLVASMMSGLMLNRGEITERQVQSMLLYLASEDGFLHKSDTWRDPYLLGTAVLTECLQQADCSADQLQRLLSEELQGRARDDLVRVTFEHDWPDLSRLFVRMRDVLRPVAGTPIEETVARALNIALDVLEYAARQDVSRRVNEHEEQASQTLGAAAKCVLTNPNLPIWPELRKEAKALCKQLEAPCFRAVPTCSKNIEHLLANDLGTPSPTAQQCGALVDLVAIQAQRERSRASVTAQVNLLRSLVNASVDQKYGAAVQLAGSVLADLIRTECPESRPCTVSITSASTEKWFGVLGAFSSYAATYEAKPSGNASSEEIERYRAEQRKKAMNDLIDAATDRRGRGLDQVFSVGVFVGVSTGQRFQRVNQDCRMAAENCSTDDGSQQWSNGLSLQAGLAYELLPKGERFKRFGLHTRLTFVDLGRFLTSSDGELSKPSAVTPLYFGGQVGLLVGNPKHNGVIAADVGYAPGMDFREDKLKTGGWQVGLVAGMYVPFVDFN